MTTLLGGPQQKDPGAPLAFDLTDQAFRQDPYRRYAELRESEVLHRTPEGFWVLTRHADVLAAVRDHRLSSNPKHQRDADGNPRELRLPLMGDGAFQLLLTADPPDHTRLRRLANKAFTPRAVERLRTRVAEVVDELLDAATAEGPDFDLMADLAEPLPVIVICELLGVPVQDQAQFKPWSETLSRMIDPDVTPDMFERAIPAVMGFVQYFGALIEERRADPRDDLLSSLIAAEAEGDSLAPQELFAMIILLFIAGHETTTNLIGNGTLALLRDRDQLAQLRAEPDLVVNATEELLRFDPPAQLTIRTATEPADVNGIPLAPGESVVCGLAAANRDPRVFDEPDALRLDRDIAQHLSFSGGMHYCLGASLARLEGQETFKALARRFPDLRLATDEVGYREHFILRGLTALPVMT
ncbi:MAG TPA: cytochrome P450 [Acidimicrobiales bacterium]|nr:cytochrome P450 [Acidimicrobiales bacterium]